MAENDYTSGLNEILGSLSQTPTTPQSPEQDIKEMYEGEMESGPTGLEGLIEGSVQTNTVDDIAFDQYAQGAAAGDRLDTMYAGLDSQRMGPNPNQQITDPNAIIGSTGERVRRGLKAGWGDLVAGTGDTIDFAAAYLSPGEAELGTSVGAYLKKVGTEYQQENTLVLSEDLQDITWNDMFKGEFWSSKISRLVPYAASFVIPYAGGSLLATRLLGRFGPMALRAAANSGKFGRMAQGVKLTGAGTKGFKGVKGTGVLGKLGVDLGKAGVKPTKLLRNISGYIGGGATANLFEGAYLSGEAYQEMINDVDENGEPLFTAEEAANHAAGVMVDNAAWIGVDVAQYAVLFGGAGRGVMTRMLRNPITKQPFGTSTKGLTAFLARRASGAGVMAGYAGAEGITEGFQEVYQEWAKYKNIQQAKNQEYDSWTGWLKDAPFGKDSGLRDIFWSSVGLGAAMGGARGYYDAAAERKHMLDKKIDSYNNVIDMFKDGQKDMTIDQARLYQAAMDNLIASNIWNYSGDGSNAIAIVDNLIKDNKITEEQGIEYKNRIELAERDYEKHHVNSSLTESGAEAAFNNEMIKTRLEGEMAAEIEAYNETVEKQKSIYKDDTKLQKKLKKLKEQHEEALKEYQGNLASINQAIENIYDAKVDEAPVAKSTGKRDARFKERLSKADFEKYTQEGEQQKTERKEKEAQEKPTITEQVKEVGTKALETVKDLGGKAVEGVKGLFGKAKEKAQSPETKETIKKVKDYTKNEITPTAKEYLIKLLEAGKITAKAAADIIGTGINKIINRGDVDKAVKKEERTESKEKAKKSQEDVKKKDQPKITPKTKGYKKTEESLEKGPRQIKNADIQKGTGANYFIKTPEGETIQYRDFDNISDKYVLEEDANVEFRLKKPIKGQENVVEVDGKLYFQFDNNLYESEIIVLINDEVVGKVAQQDYRAKESAKKAKKKDQRKIDQLVGAVKETKEKIKKFFTRAEKEIPNYEPTVVEGNPIYRYGSGVIVSSMVKDIVNKKFPGSRGVITYNKLLTDFGEEASSLAIGATLFINIDSVGQTDIVHEAGHIYYSMMEDTPLMKRIKKLLPKSELYQRTKREYPELTLMNFKGFKNMTLGLIYRNIAANTDRRKYTSDVLDIVENIAVAEKAEDSARVNDLFISLRTQIKVNGGKDVRVDRQAHLLEETFTRTLEAFSYGTVDAVVKDSATQKRLEKDIIEFYKESKKLATEEEAREILDLTVEGIATLDLENAIKAVLLNFNSAERTVPYVLNSAYGPIGKANKKLLSQNASYAAVSSHIADFIDGKRSSEEITELVMQAVADDSSLTIKEKLIQDTKDYISAIVTQLTRPQKLKKADKVLDKRISKIGIKGLTETDNMVKDSETISEFDDLIKAIALPTTTTNFIKKIVEVYNSKQEEGGLIETKKLLAALMSLAKDTKENPMDFPNLLRDSTNPNITAMLSVLDEIYDNDKVLTNAKLMEIKGPIEGINVEVLQHNVLTVGDEGKRFWSQYEDTSATIEKSVIDSVAKEIKGNKEKANKIAAIYTNLFYEERNSKGILGKRKKLTPKSKYNAAFEILDEILKDNSKGTLIDKHSLLNKEILFKGKRQFLWNILFEHTNDKTFRTPQLKYPLMKYKNKKEGFSDFVNFEVDGLIHGKQTELKTILLQGLIASRDVNYLSMVDNVEQDGVSVMNKENSLHNRARNVERIFNEGIEIDKNDIMHQDNNIYSLLALLKKNDKGVKTFHLKVHSGMMRRIINKAVGLQNKEGRSKKLTSVNPNELIAGDFFMFLNRYNQGIKSKQETIIYDQPIAVFSDKSRRYYIESIAAHNAKSRKALLSRVKNNPAYNGKYKSYIKDLAKLNAEIREKNIGKKQADKLREKLKQKHILNNSYRVFPYTIENNKIKEMPKLIKQWREYAKNNKELFKDNDAIKKGVLQDGAIEAFLTSYIANKFMAQQLFVHDHRQSKDQVDYIKRAAGAIASHTVFDRNTAVEFVVTKDYFVDKQGNVSTKDNADTAIENDAMGYVLPEQAEFIRAKYGEAQKVGNVFKFVYHYTQLEGPQKGRTTYMKFAVHTLTPELEATSTYLKNIGDILRQRKQEVDQVSKGTLIMAASESAAKLYSGGKNYIYDIGDGYNMEDIMTKQDEIYGGDAKYQGLSGEGLGIQLELDKQTDERFFPSQLFYNLATNIKQEDQVTLNRMLELRQKVMEANNTSRNASLIMNDKATEANVLAERDSFRSSVTAEVFDVLVDNTYDNLDARYPYLNAIHNSIATGRITHKGTKMYTKGSIGYQSASLGMGLKSYEKGLYAKDESIIASEAIVPGYLYDQGVRVGDLFIGTRVPAHGKVSSSVFVVKDFHAQIEGTPTSNVTIPAWVSKYWGADLDGDSIHMNFKWTPKEVAEKSWRADSNEFFDLYTKLVSKEEKQGEIQADIDFISDAENAIAKIPGLKETDSQLAPWGDAQMFEDNVPAKQLVGMIASLMRSFSVFSNSRDQLPFEITIKGESEAVTRTEFFDDATLENGIGNWYGVAQLLNISLDNAKHQYASKLGMDMQSVFPYVLLRRLGYSLNDLAVLFNSPIVKKYMDFKRDSSKDYISRASDIDAMFAKAPTKENQLLKFAKENKLGNINIKAFVNSKNPAINLNLKSLQNNKAAQKQAILMLYALEKFQQAAVDPLSKAFTVHQSIEKNPLELRLIRENIRKAQGLVRIPLMGKLGLDYSFEESTKTNNIIEHATGLFDSILQRAARTDVRYTPYMQDILSENGMKFLNDKHKQDKSEIINEVIVNNLRNEFSMLGEYKDQAEIIKDFSALKEKYPDNYFLHKVLELTERGGKKYITLNRAIITEFTSYKAVEQIKQSFAELKNIEDKNLIFEIEYTFNRFGLTGESKATSFIPFFDNSYVEKINAEMSRIIEKNQTKEADYTTGTISVELQDAIKAFEDRKAGRNNYTLNDKVKLESKNNNSFEIQDPVKKAKKVITADTSFNNDYLGSGVEIFDLKTWANDKGIDIDKIDKQSDTYFTLTENYAKYRAHYNLAKQFEASLNKKPLSKYTLEGLYSKARQFRKMDNSATKGVAYMLEKEIGQRAFNRQVYGYNKFIGLKKSGQKQGFEYKIPGVDGVAQDDLTNFQAWLGSNNMTSKRPEIQYLINEAQKEYRKYIKSFKEHKNLIEEKNNALKRSKMKGVSILERLRMGFDTNAYYQYIYGNIATLENGNIRLYTEEEIVESGVELSKEEQEYYVRYKALAEILIGSQDGKTLVNGAQMGSLESMGRSGLFGLYNAAIDSHDYYRVRVRGKDKNGKDAIKTFYEWKYDVYKGRTAKLTLDSGKKIYELDKLRKKAKELKAKNKHEDGADIILSDMEYDALVNNGEIMKRLIGSETNNNLDAELIAEYERRKGVKAQNISYDINSTLIEFARSNIFRNGEGQYKMEDGVIVENKDRYTGVANLSILTDSIIAFNKNLDNKNAVKYLTGWWKEGFLEKKQKESVLGKTGDKVIDTFVRITSLRLLGFNMTIGLGNVLAGKYQELRKRGGKQFIRGEKRFWKDFYYSREILKKHRVVEYSFDEFVHLSEKKGYVGIIEKWSYVFMDSTEQYIQGAAFLGELTDKEFATGTISEQRVMQINHKISTLHGEGYTALDASLLSMYSYGRALLQFKKWFITLVGDRFKAENIDRFGEVNIGSYRASSDFIADLFRNYFAGNTTKAEIQDIYNKSSERRKAGIRAHLSGLGIGVTLLSLIAIMEDDDDSDPRTIRRLKKLSKDIFVTTDLKRFVDYTVVPASTGTMKNAMTAIGQAITGEKTKRKSEYADKGTSAAKKTLFTKVAPYAEVKKQYLNLMYK